MEIDDGSVLACVKNGVNVIQSDLERGLSDFRDRSFDYVVLSQTLQSVRNSERIIREMLRVGREGIVTFPNFGYWKNRLQVAAGHMPVSDNLPYEWFETPNIHLCTIDDFERFCADRGVKILERKVLTERPSGDVVAESAWGAGGVSLRRVCDVTRDEGRGTGQKLLTAKTPGPPRKNRNETTDKRRMSRRGLLRR